MILETNLVVTEQQLKIMFLQTSFFCNDAEMYSKVCQYTMTSPIHQTKSLFCRIRWNIIVIIHLQVSRPVVKLGSHVDQVHLQGLHSNVHHSVYMIWDFVFLCPRMFSRNLRIWSAVYIWSDTIVSAVTFDYIIIKTKKYINEYTFINLPHQNLL